MDPDMLCVSRFVSGGVNAGMRGFFFKGLGATDLRRRPPVTQAQASLSP